VVRADRLVSILLLLQANGRMTAGALAERLEVSRRTIHRDLEALGMSGVPVVVDRGSTGGASLIAGYRTELTGLSEPELQALTAFGAGDLAADLGVRPLLESASRKLAAAAGHRQARSLQQRVLIDGDSWTRSRAAPEHLSRVQDALWSDHRLRLRYRRGEERVVERIVDPLGLVTKRGIWYLLGGVGDGRRVYRVSRIEEAEILTETFDLEAAWAEAVAGFRGTDLVRVTVRTDPDGAARVARLFGEAVVERRSDGVLDLEMSSVDGAACLLAAVGETVEVLTPAAVRERLGRIGYALVDKYAGAVSD
jgi:predicted DNA-binding transcriptional regulator YafY